MSQKNRNDFTDSKHTKDVTRLSTAFDGIQQQHPAHLFPSRMKSSDIQGTSNNHAVYQKLLTGESPVSNKSRAHSILLNTMDFKQKLDSINGLSWDVELLKWIQDSHDGYVYNIDGRMIDYIWKSRYSETQGGERETYTYDLNGNIILIEYYMWNENMSDWQINSREEYEYDKNGNAIRITSSYFNGETWDNSYMEEYAYDENNYQVLYIDYYWAYDSLKWTPQSKEETFYNDKGQDTLSLSYWYDYYSLGWYLSYKNVTAYDNNGNDTLSAGYYWNGEGWDGSSKDIYTYDKNNLVEQVISYTWDYYYWDWLLSYKEEYLRDEKGNFTQYQEFYWDTTTVAWIPEFRDEITYDLSIHKNDIALPDWWDDEVGSRPGHVSKLISYTELTWNNFVGRWDSSYLNTLYYSDFFSGPADTSCRADFTWFTDIDPTMIHFMNASAPGVVSWYWNFGDGTTSKSQNPDHKFKAEGVYTVTLSTKDVTGFCTGSVAMRIIVGAPPCNAYFDMLVNPDTRTVTFQNGSEGSILKYYWSFGDGTASVILNPIHQYKRDGIYEASLSIKNTAGTCSDQYVVRIELAPPTCNADFSVFVDLTTNTAYFKSKVQDPMNQYYWIFGDGTISTRSNPVVRFEHPGYYTAMLTISNKEAGCSGSKKKVILIGSEGIDCEADFIFNVEEGNKVYFADRSSGMIKAYYWNFGDKQFSKDMNPSNVYVMPGYYNVCLTVYAENGIQSTTCQKVLVSTEDTERCLAQFNYTVEDTTLTISCTDQSFGSPDTWKWEYKDGWTSTDQNPVYTASSPGYYLVKLHIENSAIGCEDNAFGLINVDEAWMLKAAFGYLIDENSRKADSYPVDFIGVSLGDGNKLKWTFGDGTSDSTTTTPTHEYTAPGEYEVCLIISDQVTEDADTSCQMVTVGASSVPDLGYDQSFRVYPNPFRNYTEVFYELTGYSLVDMAVYNLMGQKVSSVEYLEKPAGSYHVQIDGTNLEQGMYILRLKTNSGITTRLINLQR